MQLMSAHAFTREQFLHEQAKSDAITGAGRLAAFWAEHPELGAVTIAAEVPRDIVCIDGRIRVSHPVICIPGALLGRPLEVSARIIKQGNIGRLFSHSNGCGAAQLVMVGQKEYSDAHLSGEQVDAYADLETKKLAAALHLEYGGQLPAEGPHQEVVAYFSGLLDFNPRPFFDTILPEGFVLNAAVQSRDDALADLELALSIAFKPGAYFTPEHPFRILPVGEAGSDSLGVSGLQNSLESSLAVIFHQHPEYVGRLVVDSGIDV
jgi:hypothetical protein